MNHFWQMKFLEHHYNNNYIFIFMYIYINIYYSNELMIVSNMCIKIK